MPRPLTCPKCRHKWEQDISPDATSLTCPGCSQVLPLRHKGGKKAAPSGAAGATNAPTARVGAQPPAGGGHTVPQSDFQVGQWSTPPPGGSTPGPMSRGQRPASKRPARPTPPPSGSRPQTSASRPSASRPSSSFSRPPSSESLTGSSSDPPSGSFLDPLSSVDEISALDPLSGIEPLSSPAMEATPPDDSWQQPSSGPKVKGSQHDMLDLIGRTIDGYRIEELLGEGGMGAVFLAHQISLDRKVALKVLPKQFAQNPELLARFTREALSAAQLNHHNIVQVYDVGSNEDIHYITMEFVSGSDLGGMIKKEGRLHLDDAAAYVLQAARGLQYAHELGIIHRDIKPNNLMLNDLGVVKIADMGLAKMRGKGGKEEKSVILNAEKLKRVRADDNLTLAEMAMGTPAYMSPEQARDAAGVGPAADQYSLGCTFYYMCAGQAPYSGQTAFELISKHMSEPLTPLDAHVANVPEVFSHIITRTLEKNPEDRYPSMDGLIDDLENYLGVGGDRGAYTPREHHMAILGQQEKIFYGAPAVKLRKLVKTAFIGAIPLLFLVSLLAGNFSVAGGFLGLALLMPLTNFVINGIRTKDYLFRRVRGIFFGMPWRSWLKTGACALFVLVVLLVLGWLISWLVFLIIAAGLSFAYQWFVQRPLREQRGHPIEKLQGMLRELRIKGVQEEAIHNFVARFSGRDWEEMFETLFGYEEMIIARGKWAAADKLKPRRKFATWRDPVDKWLEGIEESRKSAKAKRQLAKVEAQRLKAKGVSAADAERQGGEEATRVMKQDWDKLNAEKEKVEKAREAAIKKARKGRPEGGKMFGLVRGAMGLGIIVAALAPMAGMGDKFEFYYAWGGGGAYPLVALAAGVALLISSFSRRLIPPLLVFFGAALFVGFVPLVEAIDQPTLTENTAPYYGMLMVAAGLVLHVLNKVVGRPL